MLRTILIGAGSSLDATIQRLGDSLGRVEVLGWIGPNKGSLSVNEHFHLGQIEDTRAILDRYRPEHVALAFSPERQEEARSVLMGLGDFLGEVWVVPDYFVANHFPGQNPAGSSRSSRHPTSRFTRTQRLAKRALDLAVGIPLTLLALPMMALLSLAVRLTSPGPVLFRQPRVGEGGRLFGMFKLRTMRAEFADPSGVEPKQPDDPRVTTVGRWLRRTSLDELPQLLNVLGGEMSLVGPRPELPVNVLRYHPWQNERFAVPQGMTGWWQIQGRKQPMYQYTREDLYYVRRRSFLQDLKILVMTPLAVLRGDGAY